MKSVMRYVSQVNKTLWDGQQLVSGIGCQPETAFDEFLSTKLLLEMQDRLFRQQMQLDTDLKMLLTKAEAQESLIKMQTSAENFEKQAGSLNERYSSNCKALTENTKLSLTAILNDTKKQLSNTVQETRKKIRTCAWISITAVILCAALCALAVLWSR